ncbi:MAG: sulfatase-like hydrolase/transferase, partial [Rhodospirillales bacterium]|nr:sulfatase-like hydrolase/transferase [Rhodospirillales bacterium]
EKEITDDDIRNARHAYYGNISYFDDWLGKIIQTLDETNLRENTIIMVISDHGDMLGERGLWYKMVFFEYASRIPMIISAPERFSKQRISSNASLLDLLPTLIDLATPEGVSIPEFADHVDGRSLVPLMTGEAIEDADEAIGEMLGEGAIAPCMMIRRGQYKYIHSDPDPAQLYDLLEDPNELSNLSGDKNLADIESGFEEEIRTRWNSEALRQEIISDQKRRIKVFQSLSKGRQKSWDHQYTREASKQFMRNHLDLNDLERSTRYPPPQES